MEGYVTEVRWCGDIDAPVFTVSPMTDEAVRMPFDCYFPRPNGKGESLIFSRDLQSMFGLNCQNANDCYMKILDYATDIVEQGKYSRRWNNDLKSYEFGQFSQRDMEYINSTIMQSREHS